MMLSIPRTISRTLKEKSVIIPSTVNKPAQAAGSKKPIVFFNEVQNY
jgi:hypothetical protein